MNNSVPEDDMTRPFGKSVLVCGVLLLGFGACSLSPNNRSALEVVESVADKVIRETVFDFEPAPQKTRLGVQLVDFKRTFGAGRDGVAYALSYILSEQDTVISFGASSSGDLKIWIEGQPVFEHGGIRRSELKEIAYNRIMFQDIFRVRLQRGANQILVKSGSGVDQWVFFLRPMTPSGEEERAATFSLAPHGLPDGASSWLCIGPFENIAAGEVYPPELSVRPFYEFRQRKFTWLEPGRNVLPKLAIPAGNSYKRESYLEWHYANGALMLALLQLADQSGEQRFFDFAEQVCAFTLANLDYFKWQHDSLFALRGSYHRLFRRTMLDDTGAPALPFVALELRGTQPVRRALVEQIADYVVNQQVRLQDGTFCRPEPVSYTVWADDLFMSVPFLLRMGKLTQAHSYDDDVAAQVVQFTDRLFDAEMGLSYHGWFGPTAQTSGVHWGRANGWMIWAISEALLYLPPDHPKYEQIKEIFRRHVAGLVKYQDASGMWHQVLDHPESYEETSCTAMFTLAMARGIRQGWIGDAYRENVLRAWDALVRKIDEDGTVHGSCRGTGIGDDLQFYFDRQTFDHDPRGLGAVITAGIEIDRLGRLHGWRSEM